MVLSKRMIFYVGLLRAACLIPSIGGHTEHDMHLQQPAFIHFHWITNLAGARKVRA